VERVGGSCEEMKWFVMGVLVICKESYHIQLYDTWKHQKECSRVNLSKCDSSSLAMPTDPTCLYYVFFFFLDIFKKKKKKKNYVGMKSGISFGLMGFNLIWIILLYQIHYHKITLDRCHFNTMIDPLEF
jgi:hypothetical protein